jgi:hypothetical protein
LQRHSSRPWGSLEPRDACTPLPAAAHLLRVRPRLGPRRRPRAVRRLRLRAARLDVRPDRRALLPGNRARRRAGEPRPRSARRRREECRHLVAFPVQRSRRRGQGAQAPRGQAAARARLEAEAPLEHQGVARAAHLLTRDVGARARRTLVPRNVPRHRRQGGARGEHRRYRVLPLGCRAEGDAGSLASRGAAGAGGRRGHTLGTSSTEATSTSTRTRAARSTEASPPSRRKPARR